MWVNSAALQACGITSDTPNPKHGLIERDSSGETTGLLMENAISLVAGKIPPPSPKLREKAIKDAVDLFHSYGIVAVHDMGDEHALCSPAVQSAGLTQGPGWPSQRASPTPKEWG